MGSLGDKFKKLAGDQTRQLLQNFQNAQSSKSKNGYSYGKLNEDGTATLADGTVVQVEVKGRPGQYAPVFNLGNGQGLVDQPEAKFFNIDSSGFFRYYSLNFVLEQQYPEDFYNYQFGEAGFYYFNYFGVVNIQLIDYLNSTTYNLDPQILSLLQDFPLPTWTFRRTGIPGSFVTSTVFEGGPICQQYFGEVPNQLIYSYSNYIPIFSTCGRDILLYQISNHRITYSYQGFEIDSTRSPELRSEQSTNVGDLFINYIILKDYYFESGLVKSSSIQSGVYRDPIRAQNLEIVFRNEYTHQNSGFYITGDDQSFNCTAALSRDTSNEVVLDLLIKSVSRVESADATLVVDPSNPDNVYYNGLYEIREGSLLYMVKNVNTNPTVSWQSDTVLGVYLEAYRGLFYGILRVPSEEDPIGVYYLGDKETYAPTTILEPLSRCLISEDKVYTSEEVIAMVTANDLPPSSAYVYQPPSPGGIPMTLYPNEPATSWATSYGSHYLSSSSWVSLVIPYALESLVRFVQIGVDVSGSLEGKELSRYAFPYSRYTELPTPFAEYDFLSETRTWNRAPRTYVGFFR
jgi:hypothetical protein